ncbi:hypothetical protein SEA_JEEVES_61 [Mycobacterium phage Jeeves]|uniref:Uncharacterized protein n=1 Tax=Mycobacterium phage Jeeves TaxID=2652402 RepID=A0A5J6T2E6_9CAUD|nr:hypothetical protein KNU75_gp048 [Mycobacterium phage Jeeves]QFG04536.1 hypothetical protein SEA_JEEVES_61 [Mycobacterium phage Jeeves]
MSSRECVHIANYAPADGGREPNRYIPSVTVDLRLFYPPTEGSLVAAQQALTETYLDALDEIRRRINEGTHV